MDVITLNDKINRRSGHIAVPYKNSMIVWGGYMERILDADLERTYSVYHFTDELWVFNCVTDVWDRVLTKGQIPPRVSGCCAVIHKDNLYTFGGHQIIEQSSSLTGTSNQLYCLNLITKTWSLLEPSGNQPAACDKLTGWVYKDKLYFFGGFGPAPNTYYQFEHILDSNTENSLWPMGWNNQLVAYNIQENCWEWPRTRGPVPAPRAAHAADITGSMVYIFGGRLRQVRNNELHCLDMNTMTWSGNLTGEGNEQEVPEGRTWHSLTFVSCCQAILYGGLSQHNSVLNDCWKLNATRDKVFWQEHKLAYDHGEPRCWHTACALFVTPKDTALVLLSGLTQPYYETALKLKDHADELLILYFKPKSLYRLCLDIACSHYKQLESEFDSLPVLLKAVVKARVQVKTS